MTRYYIALPIEHGNFAGTKARQDIETLCERRGFTRIAFSGGNSAKRNLFRQMQLVIHGIRNWSKLQKTLAPDSLVLFSYPHYPMKSAVLALYWMRRIQRTKRARFVALVHDLNSVRQTFGRAAKFSDARFLRQFDEIICHNEKMQEYLAGQGFPSDRLTPLGLFDYLAEDGMAQSATPYTPSVNLAGNLSREKSGYLYSLLASGVAFPLYLYGGGLSGAPENALVHDEGFCPAETLPARLKGAFGLVWDGDSHETCSGAFGAYLRINNPHKASLYLAGGVPLIVWSESALAPLAARESLGIAVSSLAQLNEILNQVTQSQYDSMRENAIRVGKQLRAGYYFNQAIDAVEAKRGGGR